MMAWYAPVPSVL
jgi:hypothetical protein